MGTPAAPISTTGENILGISTWMLSRVWRHVQEVPDDAVKLYSRLSGQATEFMRQSSFSDISLQPLFLRDCILHAEGHTVCHAI